MDDRLSLAIAACDLDAVVAAAGTVLPSADDLQGLVVLVQVGDGAAQAAASLALRGFLARGFPLLPAERRALLLCLSDDRSPAVLAALLGAIPHLRTPPDVAERTMGALARLAAHGDRTVRAAALEAAVALAARFPKLAAQAQACLEAASADVAPSVRARARVLGRAG